MLAQFWTVLMSKPTSAQYFATPNSRRITLKLRLFNTFAFTGQMSRRFSQPGLAGTPASIVVWMSSVELHTGDSSGYHPPPTGSCSFQPGPHVTTYQNIHPTVV